jgi:hypothetical protein
MVWPDNHATTAGLRAITRLKYSKSPFKKVSAVAAAVRGDLESVEEGTNLEALQWLPTDLPPCVRFIVSTMELELFEGRKKALCIAHSSN